MGSVATDRPWRSLRTVEWLTALLVCALVSACASSSGNGMTGPTATAVQHPLLEGFPIPNGFTPVPERSYIMKNGELRQATCEYVGELDPVAVNRFYREYMPSAGFTLRSESMIRGQWVMDFDSPSERSSVRFLRSGSRTTLLIDLSPTPKGSAEREAKPPTRRLQP